MSSISASSISEAPEEDCIKEETPFEEPDDDLCEKITQQVCTPFSVLIVILSATILQFLFLWS